MADENDTLKRAVTLRDVPEVNGRRLIRSVDDFKLPPGRNAMPLTVPEEKFALFHIAHRAQRPNHREPAFRIIGLFPTMDELRRHAAQIGAVNCSQWQAPTHHLVACCWSPERQMDNVHQEKQRTVLLTLHSRESDFEENVQSAGRGERCASMYAREALAAQRAPAPGYTQVGMPDATKLASTALVARQNFFVVIVLRDLREVVLHGMEPPEPLFAVLRAFANLEDATFYAKHTAHKAYPACNVDIIDACEWVFPESVNRDELQEEYGIERVGQVMQARKRDMQGAKDYERVYEAFKQAKEKQG